MTHTPSTTHIPTPTPSRHTRSWWIGTLIFLVVAAGLLAPITSAAAAPRRGDRPYLRLFTEVADCGQVLDTNQMKGRALKRRLGQLRRWYVHFHSEGSNTFVMGKDCRGSSRSTLAAKLSTRHTWVSNYRNGSFVSQASPGQVNFHEAANIERRAPLAIGTFWPGNYRPNTKGNNGSNDGRLTRALSASETTLRISTAGDRPSGAPATWPFIDSRGSGAGARRAFGQHPRLRLLGQDRRRTHAGRREPDDIRRRHRPQRAAWPVGDQGGIPRPRLSGHRTDLHREP